MSLINTYEDYLHALKNSPTEMFWVIHKGVRVHPNFKFDIYFTHDNEYDRKINHVFKNQTFDGDITYDGIWLLSKHKEISQREFDSRHIVERKEWDIVASTDKPYDQFIIETYEDYLSALENSSTEMFWVVPKKVQLNDDFKFDLYFRYTNTYDRNQNHVFKNQTYDGDIAYDGVWLLSKNKQISKREFNSRHIVERKEWDIVASTDKPYDQFVVNTYEDYLSTLQRSSTEMFWVVPKKVQLNDDFKFDLYFPFNDEFNRNINHVFKNQTHTGDITYDGIWLLSKHKEISQREFDSRHIVERKEWDVIASKDKLYDKFVVNTYTDYLSALENSTTEMFWIVPNQVQALDDFKFDLFFDFRTDEFQYDRSTNHVFKNLTYTGDITYDGIWLLSKDNVISKREFESRHIVERKEWDVLASKDKLYDKFIIDTYDDYLSALEKSTTEMFWIVPNRVNPINNFSFDLFFDFRTDEFQYDRSTNHVFKNVANSKNITYDGVWLLSKDKQISEREFNSRHIVERKEWDVVASADKLYDKFVVDSYDDYCKAVNNSTTEMFWITFNQVQPTNDFKFDLFFDFRSDEYEYDRNIHHVFKNQTHNGKTTYDGVWLLSKDKQISEREFDSRHIVERKEWDVIASKDKLYDKFVVNTYTDYLSALKNSTTEMFWVIPNRTHVESNFQFDLFFDFRSDEYAYDRNIHHVFKNQTHTGDITYDGVWLLSKDKQISEREFNNRHIIERKEWDVVASKDKLYDKFVVDTYTDYLSALSNSTTEMFWIMPNQVQALDDFKFDLFFDFRSDEYAYDRGIHHVFKNITNDNNVTYDGVWLLSKDKQISEREFNNRHIIERKEWDVVASKDKLYDKFVVDTYDDYLSALSNSTTEMFWVIPNRTQLVDDFSFDLFFDFRSDEYVYDRSINHVFRNLTHTGDITYDGIWLLSKNSKISKREFESRHIVERKEWDVVASKDKLYDKFVVNSYDDYLSALSNSTTEMFWIMPNQVQALDDFKFDLFFDFRSDEYAYDRSINHVFKNQTHNGETTYDGVWLLNKKSQISEREFNNRHIIERKEWDVLASADKLYDKFVVNSYDDYLSALSNSTTEMFWTISKYINPTNDFKFDLFFDFRSDEYEYDRNIHHVFKNQTHDNNVTYDGIWLLNKKSQISEREFNSRHIVERKEWDVLASKDKLYDKFVVNTYTDYLSALENSTTEMFWIVPNQVQALDDFKFDLFFDFRSDEYEYDRSINHVFKNTTNNNDITYDGVWLLSKDKQISEREFNSRHIVERKEWDVLASKDKLYDKFIIDTYDDYLSALEKSTTEMFWAVSKYITPVDTFNFELFFDFRSDEHDHDRSVNHAFLHKVNDKLTYDGVWLLSKNTPVSKREIESRHIIERKEWDVIASGPRLYDKFVIDTYEDYLAAKEQAETELFWIIPKELEVDSNFKFDLYFDHRGDDYVFERNIHHSFKHQFENELNYNGISLVPKSKTLGQREIKYRSLVETKHYDIVASKLRPYDIVFISYNEPNADENYERLLSLYPRAKRVHKVKGIHNAHIRAAQLADTKMFWVVDGDAVVLDTFKFDYQVSVWDQEVVHVWASRNPVNDLEYGYGGVKLLPRNLTLNLDITTTDMTTSISKDFKSIKQVSNITAFDTDEFSTWKSAFRECVKLVSGSIDRQEDEETSERLKVWTSVGKGKYGSYSIQGAKDALEFVEQNNDIKLINDFDYLETLFNSKYK